MPQGPDTTSWDLFQIPSVTLAICSSLLHFCLCFFSKEGVKIELTTLLSAVGLSIGYIAVLTTSFLPILTFLYHPRHFFLEVSMSSVNLSKISTAM